MEELAFKDYQVGNNTLRILLRAIVRHTFVVFGICNMFFLAIPSISPGNFVNKGGNALTKVDPSMHCDKGHVTWSHVIYLQLTDRTIKVCLEGLDRIRLKINKGESEGKANGQCLHIQMCDIQIPFCLSSQKSKI